MAPTKKTSTSSVDKPESPRGQERMASKKHARAYPDSSSPSIDNEEEDQINRAVQSIKDLMHRDKMTLVEANVLLNQKILERTRETEERTGTHDTKILMTAIQRLLEAGVE